MLTIVPTTRDAVPVTRASSPMTSVPTSDPGAVTLHVAVMRLARRLRAERADHGLTLTQLSALATLQRHGPLTPRALADHERVTPPSMTRTLAALADAGLVTRSADPLDGRSQVIALTPAAEELLARDRQRRADWLASRTATLSDTDRVTLERAAVILEGLAES